MMMILLTYNYDAYGGGVADARLVLLLVLPVMSMGMVLLVLLVMLLWQIWC
jgi:hypothetical protein